MYTLTDPHSIRKAHLKFYRQKGFLRLIDRSEFTSEEQRVLNDSGYWLEALASGKVPPVNDSQSRFSAVIRGEFPPESLHEKAWVKYQHLHPPGFTPTLLTNHQSLNGIAFDFETANAKRNSACALGLARLENGQVVETQYWLIRPPDMYFAPGNIRVHGITPDMVENAPTFEEAWPEIRPYLEQQFLVAHNAAFDVGVLRHSLNSYRLPWPSSRYACTVQLARRILKNRTRHGLAALSRFFQIELNHHHAESDAIACAKVLSNLAQIRASHSVYGLLEQVKIKMKEL